MAKIETLNLEAILRERISSHTIPPGSKLREVPLSEEFGVSRARVRQAFANLEQRGLVERVPNQGARVVITDAKEIFGIYDVFELLEGLCVRLAVQNEPEEDWADLHHAFGPNLANSVSNGSCDELFEAIMLYRDRTQQAAANPTLNSFLEAIYDKTQMIIRRTLVLPGRAEQSLAEHRAIVDAMRRGDAAKAESLKRENMRTARHFLERYKTFIL